MIPISIADQLDALIHCRKKMEAAPDAAWNAYLEGHYGPERAATKALDAEVRKQKFQSARRQIINALNLPVGVTPIWKHHASVEIVGFKATLLAPAHGNRRLGQFPSVAEAVDAINNLRAELDAAQQRRIKLTPASLPEMRTKSGLPSGVIKRSAKCGDRYSAVIHDTGKQRMISTHDTPEEAHRAYCKAHIELHGERSRYWNQRHAL